MGGGGNPAVETSGLTAGLALRQPENNTSKNNLSSLDVFSGIKVHGRNVLAPRTSMGTLQRSLDTLYSWIK